MKRNKANIFFSWLLLVCFIAGQYMVYTHRHKIIAGNPIKTHSLVKSPPHAVIHEKCAICDAMHHINAVVNSYAYFSLNIVTKHFYKIYNYAFVSIALILSAGRAPPAVAFC